MILFLTCLATNPITRRPPRSPEEDGWARKQGRNEATKRAAKSRLSAANPIPIEGPFGQGKHGYQLNYISVKRADTLVVWINSIFLVMNLLILERIFFVPCKKSLTKVILRLKQVRKLHFSHSQNIFLFPRVFCENVY